MNHIYSFKGFTPVVHPSSFVHELATIIGNVQVGKHVYIGPGAVLRGDWGEIIVEDGCNVQENCVLHMFPGKRVHLKDSAHIGHGAVIHGAVVGENSLIGMNSVLMDDVVVEKECIIGALSFVKAEEVIKKRSLYAGNPAKFIKPVSDQMLDWKTAGTRLYQGLPEELKKHMVKTDPLRSAPKFKPKQDDYYNTLKDTLKNQ